MMYKDQDQAYDGFFLNDADHPVICNVEDTCRAASLYGEAYEARLIHILQKYVYQARTGSCDLHMCVRDIDFTIFRLNFIL